MSMQRSAGTIEPPVFPLANDDLRDADRTREHLTGAPLSASFDVGFQVHAQNITIRKTHVNNAS